MNENNQQYESALDKIKTLEQVVEEKEHLEELVANLRDRVESSSIEISTLHERLHLAALSTAHRQNELRRSGEVNVASGFGFVLDLYLCFRF